MNHICFHWLQYPNFPGSSSVSPSLKKKKESQLDIHCLHLPSRYVSDLLPRSQSQSQLAWLPGTWPRFRLYHIPQHPRDKSNSLLTLRNQHSKSDSAAAVPQAQTRGHCGSLCITSIFLLKQILTPVRLHPQGMHYSCAQSQRRRESVTARDPSRP